MEKHAAAEVERSSKDSGQEEDRMEKNTELAEQLLDAWLRLSSVVSNNRLVSGLSFNEAFVLNLLYKQYELGNERKLTATDLCRQTNILKSQMNAILTALEKKQLILRRRSDEDHRQIEVEIHPEGVDTFMECHRRSLGLVKGVLTRVGEHEGQEAVGMLNRLAAGFEEMVQEGRI